MNKEIMKNSAITYFFLSFIFIVISAPVNAQDDSDDKKPTYGFDTTLKGGYFLHYTTDDSLQYLYLRKGEKLKLISTEEIYNKQYLLGFVAADFDDHFLLVHTMHILHQEDPIMCDLYEKKTMNLVMRSYFITWEGNYLLLHNADGTNRMQLYNLTTKKSEYFLLPDETKHDARLVNAIKIKAITTESLTLKYYITPDLDVQKVKVYKRK